MSHTSHRAQNTAYAYQTFTIEYTVPGSLDGVTLSPPIEAPAPNDDPQSIYRPVVDSNLGLINVDYVVPASGPRRLGVKGDRYVQWIWLESPVVGAFLATVDIVDVIDGTLAVQRTIATLTGSRTYYNELGFLVPQGSLVRLRGFTNATLTPIKVRLNITEAP